MEKASLGYCIKNIPIPTQKSYLLELMEKIEIVIKIMRWKGIHFRENEDNKTKAEWLKSLSSLRPMKELTPLENDLISLVQNIKFRNVKNHFQDQLQQDLKRINASNKIMTFPDKTRNMYRLTREEYDMILNGLLTATYKNI